MKLNVAIRDVSLVLSDKVGSDSFTSSRKEHLKASEVDKIRLVWQQCSGHRTVIMVKSTQIRT